MLLRYPGLTLVGVLGMAVGIAIAAGGFSIIAAFTTSSLPLDEGDRIVILQHWDAAGNRPERRVAHDLATWRRDLRSIRDISAYRQVSRNLIAPGIQTDTVMVAEMSAAGFRVARVKPLMGRALLDEDEQPGAPPVLVIAYDVWQRRFNGDAAILGRVVQVGETKHAIVGVMPEGFRFPVAHEYWVPFTLAIEQYQPRTGPSLLVFGRLTDGVSLETAHAELHAIGERTAAASPATHAQLRPTVVPYPNPFFDIHEPTTGRFMGLLRFVMSAVLLVVCVNVAILVYARTATRHAEIAIRSALGASRRRIVALLFLEALALSSLSALVGLGVTAAGFRLVNASMRSAFGQVPFWWEFRLTADAVLYVIALTVLAAAIVGIVPALKATGRRVQTGLQTISAGAGSGMQLGRLWTLMIVMQVAMAVALLPATVFSAWTAVRSATSDPGFAAEEFLATQLVLDQSRRPEQPQTEMAARFAARFADVIQRVRSESAVTDVTYAMALPGQEATVWIEAEGVKMPAKAADYRLDSGSNAGHLVRFNRVDVRFFDVFGIGLVTGRPLHAQDAQPSSNSIVVNRSFARQLFGEDNVLGRRIRYVGRSGDAPPDHVQMNRWYDIVGVVGDFPAQTESGLSAAKLYHAATEQSLGAAYVAIRLNGTSPAAFTTRLREIATSVDPNLQLRGARSLDDVLRTEQSMMRNVALGLVLLTLSVLALSAAGIYALMSFTVSQRRKEIGIRTALGADTRRILWSVFGRALVQLGAGLALGAAAATLLDVLSDGEMMQGQGAVVLPVVAALMLAVGLAAAWAPARRGLRVHPTEALRAE
jgi:predicted permease